MLFVLVVETRMKIPSNKTGTLGRPSSRSKTVSVCVHKISKCHWILENENGNLIINRVHATTKVNAAPNMNRIH